MHLIKTKTSWNPPSLVPELHLSLGPACFWCLLNPFQYFTFHVVFIFQCFPAMLTALFFHMSNLNYIHKCLQPAISRRLKNSLSLNQAGSFFFSLTFPIGYSVTEVRLCRGKKTCIKKTLQIFREITAINTKILSQQLSPIVKVQFLVEYQAQFLILPEDPAGSSLSPRLILLLHSLCSDRKDTFSP